MDSFVAFMSSVPGNAVPRIEQAIERAVAVLSDPNATAADRDAALRALDEVPRQLNLRATNAVRGEVSNRLRAQFTLSSVDEEAAEKILEQLSNGGPSHVETGRISAKVDVVRPATNWVHFKVISLGVAAAGFFGFLIHGGIQEGQRERHFKHDMESQRQTDEMMRNLQRDQEAFDRAIHGIHVTEQEFQFLRNTLSHPGEAQPAPVGVALPPSIAAIAERPVLVVIESNDQRPVQGQTTVQDFYTALPEPQRQVLESAVQRGRDWNRTITVTSPVGTFHGSGF